MEAADAYGGPYTTKWIIENNEGRSDKRFNNKSTCLPTFLYKNPRLPSRPKSVLQDSSLTQAFKTLVHVMFRKKNFLEVKSQLRKIARTFRMLFSH